MAVQTKKDFQFTIEQQSAWDTAVDSTASQLLTEDVSISIEPNNHNVPVARGIRGSHESDNWNDLTGVVPTASGTVWMTPTMMLELMPGMLQAATAWTDSGSDIWDMYTHDTCGDFPDPKTDDDGYFYTLTRRACQAAKSSYIKNALPTNFTLKISATDNDQLLIMDTEWIGQGYSRAESPSATITENTLGNIDYSYANIGAVSWGAYDLTTDFKGAEISLTNGAKYVDDLPTGPVVFNGWEVSGSFTVAAGANTETMKGLCEAADADDGRFLTISFGDGTVSSAGEANITAFCYLDSFEENFDEGEVITFNFRGLFGDVGSSEYPFRIQFYAA